MMVGQSGPALATVESVDETEGLRGRQGTAGGLDRAERETGFYDTAKTNGNASRCHESF